MSTEPLPDLIARLRGWQEATSIADADPRAIARAKDEALLALTRLLAIAEAAQAVVNGCNDETRDDAWDEDWAALRAALDGTP